MIPDMHIGMEVFSQLSHDNLVAQKLLSCLHVSFAWRSDTKKQFGNMIQTNNTTLNISLVYSTNTDSSVPSRYINIS